MAADIANLAAVYINYRTVLYHGTCTYHGKRRSSKPLQPECSATRIVMLLTAVALLGFASSPGGGPDPADAVCADTPDRTMIGITHHLAFAWP